MKITCGSTCRLVGPPGGQKHVDTICEAYNQCDYQTSLGNQYFKVCSLIGRISKHVWEVTSLTQIHTMWRHRGHCQTPWATSRWGSWWPAPSPPSPSAHSPPAQARGSSLQQTNTQSQAILSSCLGFDSLYIETKEKGLISSTSVMYLVRWWWGGMGPEKLWGNTASHTHSIQDHSLVRNKD